MEPDMAKGDLSDSESDSGDDSVPSDPSSWSSLDVRRCVRWVARTFRVRRPRASLLPRCGTDLLQLDAAQWLQICAGDERSARVVHAYILHAHAAATGAPPPPPLPEHQLSHPATATAHQPCATTSFVLGFARSTLAREAAAADQLEEFFNSTQGPVGTITTTFGCPLTSKYTDGVLDNNEDILWNVYLFERLSALNRENIPQRIVHGKGTGAKGYFKVTHDVTHITNAAVFSKVGKITPVRVRFSSGTADRGSADTVRATFSLSTKFYTEEGNWDMLGFTTDTFFFKDLLKFPSAIHALSKNPKTHLKDNNTIVDFIISNPEAVDIFLQILGDPGLPASYRNIPSHSIHAFQVENYKQEVSFVRFVFSPDLGEKYLNTTEGMMLAGTSPDYYVQDLYNAIAEDNYPTWTVGFQVIKEKYLHKLDFDPFDLTVRWPKKYKVRPIGKLVLNKNPENSFHEVEQLAFNPANLPPGMQGCDKVLLARAFAYRDAATYRLGVNFNNIEVNRPVNEVYNYNRNGQAPVLDNFGGTPNYYPNSFNGPVPAFTTRTKTKRRVAQTVSGPTNFKQASQYYRSLSQDAKQRLLGNIVPLFRSVYESLRNRAVDLFTRVDAELGQAIRDGLAQLASQQQAQESFSDEPVFTHPGL